ncbi:MAG: hypothetical protein AAFO82_06020 [Bacteroidota bacterium]
MKKLLPSTVDVMILTPIPIEYQGIRNYLHGIHTVEQEGIYYEVGHFQGLHHHYSVAIREIGANNTTSSLATEKAVNHFQPSIIILFGIAGGIKDVKIGDIVIGECSYDYETGKETAEGSLARPQSTNYDSKLIEFARHVNRQGKWRQKLLSQHYPSVLFGAVASGNKVVSSTDSLVFRYIKKHLNNSLCLEMEASGFGKVVDQNRDRLRPFLIRGISDLINNKSTTDGEGGQELAVQNAATFLFGFLKELDFLNYKMISMNAKELTKELMSLFVPILKLESVNQIGEEFKEATNTSILEMWEKVRPLFIEEIEELKSDPEDEEVLEESRVGMRKKLRKALEENDVLKKQLESLINQTNEKDVQGMVSIVNSKNVVQGSTITVGGDFNLGDKN